MTAIADESDKLPEIIQAIGLRAGDSLVVRLGVVEPDELNYFMAALQARLPNINVVAIAGEQIESIERQPERVRFADEPDWNPR